MIPASRIRRNTLLRTTGAHRHGRSGVACLCVECGTWWSSAIRVAAALDRVRAVWRTTPKLRSSAIPRTFSGRSSASTTEPESKPRGYDNYDEEFRNQYLNCLGNYLLLSKSHNCAVGNIPLASKLATYVHNEQQREVKGLVPDNGIWSKEIIQKRKKRIIDVIMSSC